MTGAVRASWELPFQEISAEIDGRRLAVTNSLLEALATLADGWSPTPFWRDHPKLAFAVAHHAIHAARQAVARHDMEGARAALALLETTPRTVDTSIGPLIVIDTASCVVGPQEQRFLANATTPSEQVSDADARDAVCSVVETGMGGCLRQELAVVVALGRVSNDAMTNAFSVATLPGTVFLEWTPLSARAGELLLHECGHSWLNEALDLYGEDLDGPERWYSPWKRRRRSAFGIVHAVMSFSLLVEYFARLERSSHDTSVVDFARQRRAAEAKRLSLVRPAALECLAQVRHVALRTFLQVLLDDAIGGELATETIVWTTG